MSNKKKKNAVQIDRDVEIQGAKMFGKHVSKEKGKLLLLMTVLACAAPVLLGLRLWDAIPELYETGLIGTNGEDDSAATGPSSLSFRASCACWTSSATCSWADIKSV